MKGERALKCHFTSMSWAKLHKASVCIWCLLTLCYTMTATKKCFLL